MAKLYVIVKDGTQIKTARSLNSAKIVANQEQAEVFCAGELVYQPQPEFYRLKALMNVRKAPSLVAEILGQAKAGTEVKVRELKDDWLTVEWGNGFAFILFGGGKFAERRVA